MKRPTYSEALSRAEERSHLDQTELMPNELFALECLLTYAENGDIVDSSNGEFCHCPIPACLGGEHGYWLTHEDHQVQGALQAKDVGRCSYFKWNVENLLHKTFTYAWFELWDILEATPHPQQGTKRSAETRAKISEKAKGRVVSQEARANISKANSGKKFSAEHKAKISEAHKGKERSEEHRANLSKANKGKHLSDETKAKMSATTKGRKRSKPFSAETRAKMSASGKRKVFSEEHKANLSKARKNRAISEEQKSKQSELAKARWAKWKEEGRKSPSLSRKRKQVKCPHCGKCGDPPGMSRWHFDNCKQKEAN